MRSSPISVIIPVWNGERFLDQALDSVFAQTLPADEIIVVDDGSTDGSVAIAAARGPAVKIIQRANGGCAAARNTGVAAAQGALFAFLDADDLWMPDKLLRQTQALADNPHAGCCVTLIDAFADDEIGHQTFPESLTEAKPGYIASALMVRREGWDTVGPIDEDFVLRAVFDWFARVERSGIGTITVPEVLARRRLHGANYSRHNPAASVDAAFATISRHRAARKRDL